MFRKFEVYFTKECAEYVRQEYTSANNIVEYGSGGSTLIAAELGKTVITTESSAAWLVEVMGAYKENKLQGHIIPIYADIGPTGNFGHPKDETNWKNWPTYATKAWKYCSEHQLDADLVLIDGRYRVACFIASCINTKTSVKVLFDDYVDRPNYHIVEKLSKPNEIIDNRMAVFQIEPNMIAAEFILENIGCFYNPA